MEGRGSCSPRRTWHTSRSTEIPESSTGSAPKRDQARSEMQSRHRTLEDLWAAFPWSQPEGLALPVFRGGFWTHGRANVAGISRLGEVGRHSELCEFHSCALCHEVSHHWLFTKIPSSSLAPEIILFRSSEDSGSLVRIGTKADLKTDSFAVFETSRFGTTKR